jgi:hypothetical protein
MPFQSFASDRFLAILQRTAVRVQCQAGKQYKLLSEEMIACARSLLFVPPEASLNS